jgi:hypothetical protein
MAIFADGFDDMRQLRRPLHFRVGDDPAEYDGETLGISAEYLVLISPIALTAGVRLFITLPVPMEDSRGSFTEIHIVARVVSGSKLSKGRIGYQVKIERQNTK